MNPTAGCETLDTGPNSGTQSRFIPCRNPSFVAAMSLYIAEQEHLALKKLVCLDLEGTLISNAVSQIPRPGLGEFLLEVSGLAEMILYTSVSPSRTQDIKRLLVEEGCAPQWFLDTHAIHPVGTVKYQSNVPNFSDYSHALLVDDQSAVVATDELGWWVPVKEYLPPYSTEDFELSTALELIRTRLK